MCNAKVYFADVDPKTGLIIPELIEKKLQNKRLKIKIVTIVHLGGRVCNIKLISKITKNITAFSGRCCHAPGAFYNDKNTKFLKLGHVNIVF